MAHEIKTKVLDIKINELKEIKLKIGDIV